ncbi:unnamed protein product [Urochloa decumbens]|uniref:DUF4220 domain-containing protein n=1 Tax=Urochloa decumbens TaxID=240449 RepID=A0ABC9BWV9_9POAL
MFVTSAVQLWSKWGLWISVLSSLVAYALLGLLSGTRRRLAPGWRFILRWAVLLIIWVAYQAAEIAATSALGSLSLSGSDASADEQELTAFWAPFLFLHLGGPDNMTAYTLEDNMLSLRKAVEMYVERAWALWRANLDNMQDSSKKEPAGSAASRSCSTSIEVAVESTISRSLVRDLDDDEALLLAQDLFHIWHRALPLVDSSVDPRSRSQRTSEKILSLPWRNMYVHRLPHHPLHVAPRQRRRCLALLSGSIAARKTAGSGDRLSSSDHLPLAGCHLRRGCGVAAESPRVHLDVLLPEEECAVSAMGTTRSCALGGGTGSTHRAVVYLDPLRLALGIDPVRHRRWSGTIGPAGGVHYCSPSSVVLVAGDQGRTGGNKRGERAELFERDELPPIHGSEFEQDVLAWHIATCIFLSRAKVRKLPKSSTVHVPAIEAMSEYLMFLVAQRRQMLPGLVLHSLLDGTRRALKDIWDRPRSFASQEETTRGREPQMLELIFNVWVDKLVYAGVRCSRECHAKQLSAGGELTTMLWIIVHHAGPFRIGEEKPPDKPKPYGYWMPPMLPTMPPPSMVVEEKPKAEMMPIPEDDEDPDDAEDYKTPIEYITLY